MLAIIKHAIDGYQYLFEELRDQRTKKYFLLGNPFGIVFLVILYHKFVTDWGPKFMKNREPFQIKGVMIVYNIFQILYNAFIVAIGSKYTYIFGDYNYFCQAVDTSDTPEADVVVWGSYLYFVSKVIDLLDTVFFVLRKKQVQVTFLHKFHHISMCIFSYIGLAYIPGGHAILMGIINSFVHVIMYFYYLVALLDREGKYIWWKKHITQLQIAQFSIIALHWVSLLVHPYCGYPKWTSVVALPFNAAFMILFLNFYDQAYIKKIS